MTAKQILFDGIDSSGRQGLWVTDGTAGTREIAVSGASSSGLNPFGFTSVNGKGAFRRHRCQRQCHSLGH